MRALTPVEVQNLEHGTLPPHTVGPCISDDEIPVVHRLAKRGLVSIEETDEYVGIETTARGQLALRVHRAYLASLGGA